MYIIFLETHRLKVLLDDASIPVFSVPWSTLISGSPSHYYGSTNLHDASQLFPPYLWNSANFRFISIQQQQQQQHQAPLSIALRRLMLLLFKSKIKFRIFYDSIKSEVSMSREVTSESAWHTNMSSELARYRPIVSSAL